MFDFAVQYFSWKSTSKSEVWLFFFIFILFIPMIIKKIYTIDSPVHLLLKKYITRGRSYVSWISNYLCNQCLSPVKLWVWTPLKRGVLNTTLCDKVCQWLATGRWFSQGTPVSSTNKTDRHDITEILLKVALNTINPNQTKKIVWDIYLSI